MKRVYQIMCAGAVLLSAAALSGCTYTDHAIFPEAGERTILTGNVACTNISADGTENGVNHFNVVEVGDKTKGYTYYSFEVDGNGNTSEPMVFSLQKTEEKNIYIGQVFADSIYNYFWYNSKTGLVSYAESELMSQEALALAEAHDVALETKTKQYFQMVHGKDDDIKEFLLTYGKVFKGGGMKCVSE